jgi:hypothetical protein
MDGTYMKLSFADEILDSPAAREIKSSAKVSTDRYLFIFLVSGNPSCSEIVSYVTLRYYLM